jgi:serine/threonine-protein kinase
MAVILEGQQRSLGRAVALKTLRDEDDSKAKRDALVREGQVMALLEHPNIVPIYTLSRVGNKPAIVLKKIAGERWGDRLRAADLEWNIGILFRVIDAIRFAHSRGILHCDLKPSNVMIGEFGEVYVLDWGSAVSTREEHRGRLPLATEAVRLAGSPPYMAPEVLSRRQPPSEATDVYLLGAILYELVMGTPPHMAASQDEMCRKVERNQPVYSRDLPIELVALLKRAMRKDPAQRFQSVDAFKSALADFMEHRASEDLLVRGQLLLEALRVESAVPDAEQRGELYGIYRRCKFTLQESLRLWPDNAEASTALERCGDLVVDYELSRGEPAAAAALLAELGITSGERAGAVQAALRLRNRREAEADSLRRDTDFNTDAGTRRVVMASIGLLWAFVPLWLFVALAETSYASQSAAHVGFLGVLGLIGLRGRMCTSINRALFQIVLCGALSAIAVNFGSWMMGLPPFEAQVYHLFVFFVCGLTTTFTLDWRAWPTTLAYFVAYLLSAYQPDLCLLAMSAANTVLAANSYLIWRGAEEAVVAV